MERKVLLSLGERKKIASLPPSYSDVKDSAILKDAAREHFSITAGDSEITLQTYDGDFDDWVDADEDCTVSHKDRVKIVLSECQVSEQIFLQFAAARLDTS